jgi:hypothetical protein
MDAQRLEHFNLMREKAPMETPAEAAPLGLPPATQPQQSLGDTQQQVKTRQAQQAEAAKAAEQKGLIEAEYGNRLATDVPAFQGKTWHDPLTMKPQPEMATKKLSDVLATNSVPLDARQTTDIATLTQASEVLNLLGQIVSVPAPQQKRLIESLSNRVGTYLTREYFPALTIDPRQSTQDTARAVAKALLENEYFKGNSEAYAAVSRILDAQVWSTPQEALKALQQAQLTVRRQMQAVFGIAEAELSAPSGQVTPPTAPTAPLRTEETPLPAPQQGPQRQQQTPQQPAPQTPQQQQKPRFGAPPRLQ